jgi:hypothetical protein
MGAQLICECGNMLEVPEEAGRFQVIFCERCYLNLEVVKEKNSLRIIKRYYFPDD